MKIEVDRGRCEGHAMCEAVAPQYFSVDDDGNVAVRTDNVAPGDQAQVQDAVLACPVAALRVIEELSRQ
jgi:ferredoxin